MKNKKTLLLSPMTLAIFLTSAVFLQAASAYSLPPIPIAKEFDAELRNTKNQIEDENKILTKPEKEIEAWEKNLEKMELNLNNKNENAENELSKEADLFDSVFTGGNTNIIATANDTVQVGFSFKNTGNKPWHFSEGENKIFLKIYQGEDYDVSKNFENLGWVNNKMIRAVRIRKNEEGSQTATFNCEMTMPEKIGIYKLKMQMFVENDNLSESFGQKIELTLIVKENLADSQDNEDKEMAINSHDSSLAMASQQSQEGDSNSDLQQILKQEKAHNAELMRIIEAKKEDGKDNHEVIEKIREIELKNQNIKQEINKINTDGNYDKTISKLQKLRTEKQAMSEELSAVSQQEIRSEDDLLAANTNIYSIKKGINKVGGMSFTTLVAILSFLVSFVIFHVWLVKREKNKACETE